ncbi:hypothetical protein DSM104299_04818 [Baekduia alba]|nr:hypothetical protein DSM104299_04818 [Baekduia alba]
MLTVEAMTPSYETVEVDSGHLIGVDAPGPWLATIDALLERVPA